MMLSRTVGRMDAAAEHTGMYSLRVLDNIITPRTCTGIRISCLGGAIQAFRSGMSRLSMRAIMSLSRSLRFFMRVSWI